MATSKGRFTQACFCTDNPPCSGRNAVRQDFTAQEKCRIRCSCQVWVLPECKHWNCSGRQHFRSTSFSSLASAEVSLSIRLVDVKPLIALDLGNEGASFGLKGLFCQTLFQFTYVRGKVLVIVPYSLDSVILFRVL